MFTKINRRHSAAKALSLFFSLLFSRGETSKKCRVVFVELPAIFILSILFAYHIAGSGRDSMAMNEKKKNELAKTVSNPSQIIKG